MTTTFGSASAQDIPQAMLQLRDHISGTMIEPGDPSYDEDRAVWNGMIDVRPRVIVRARSTSDIAPVLQVAQETGLPLAVRGGGHNVAGHGTVADGIVLDLGQLNQVEVDPKTRIVKVQAGATLADVDRATSEHGLAIPLGVISGTGVAGLTLGGGLGWLTRTYGLSIDCLIAVDLFTANGEHLHVSEDEHPELFWGIRGCGGNFGVVTSFTFHAVRMPATIVGGNLFYQPQHWRSALLAFEQWSKQIPDELNVIVTTFVLPPEFEAGDNPWMIIGYYWAGDDPDEGHAHVKRLREAAPPDMEESDPPSWVTRQQAMDEIFPKGSRGYWKNVAFDRLDEEVVDVLVDLGSRIDWRGTGIDIHLMGGKFARVPDEATAFPNRSARFWLNIYGFWQDPADDERLVAFAREAYSMMKPFAAQGEYVNFLAAADLDHAADTTRRAYGDIKYQRLVALKDQYDPHNLFRLNHNVAPSAS
jgi:FAD/FMN-containing dehydrogenase